MITEEYLEHQELRCARLARYLPQEYWKLAQAFNNPSLTKEETIAIAAEMCEIVDQVEQQLEKDNDN